MKLRPWRLEAANLGRPPSTGLRCGHKPGARPNDAQHKNRRFRTFALLQLFGAPAWLLPMTAQALPGIGDGGMANTFDPKTGIYGAPDPAFKGLRRELTARAYAYNFTRLFAPINRSPCMP